MIILNKLMPYLFILFGFGLCISEPFSRNVVRVFLLILVISVLIERSFFYTLKNLIVKYKNFTMLMSLFIIWMVISAFYGGNNLTTTDDSLTYWFFFNHNMFLFIVIAMFVRNEEQLYNILFAIISSLMLDNIYIRLQSAYGVLRPETFLHGSYMQGAILYVVLLPVMLSLILYKEKIYSDLKYLILWSIFITSIISFIFMNTRGAWLSLFIVLPMLLIYYIRNVKKLLTVGLALLALANVFLITFPDTLNRIQSIKNFDNEQSVTERFLIWKSAINMIEDNPIMGVGLGNYKDKYQKEYILPEAKERFQMHAHNSYLHFWAETGLPGVFLFCAIFFYTLKWAWEHRRSIFGMILFSSTLAILLYNMTDYTYAGYSAMRVYWVIFGISLKGVDLIESRNNNAWNRDKLRRDSSGST